MEPKRYVQHISGQGEKWLVTMEQGRYWQVDCSHEYKGDHYYLPKSEYRLCETPEKWVDITEECEIGHDEQTINYERCMIFINAPGRLDEFRLRKILFSKIGFDRWAFLVEKKVSE